jgi:hypothetical protein
LQSTSFDNSRRIIEEVRHETVKRNSYGQNTGGTVLPSATVLGYDSTLRRCVVRRILQGSIVAAVLGLIIPSLAMATETSRSQGRVDPAVQGELIKIEDKVFTVKDPTGKERQLKIDQETAQVGVFHQGVYVLAWVLPDGRTESIIAFRKNKDSERELAAQP